MRLRRMMLAIMAGGVLALMLLVGCQSHSEQKTNEKTDVEIMEELVRDEELALPESPFYILIVGNDSRVGTTEIVQEFYADGTGRSDTIMLVRIDPKTYQVALVTIPRDMESFLDGNVVKINEIYRQGGIDALVNEVEELTGVAILYHLDMGFVEFENFVNEIGGITANVPIDMVLADIVNGGDMSLSAGTQELDGSQTLVLARVRKAYAGPIEACRQIQDRQIVEVAIKQVASDPLNAAVHADTLLGNVKTNWPAEELSALVLDFAKNADSLEIVSGTGPYEGDFMEEYGGLWLVPRDESSWKEIIRVMDEGGNPTEIISLPEVAAA